MEWGGKVTTAGQQMARQANANVNKNVFGNILYNVKAYGAKGDGETDDTAKIQKAMNDARTDGVPLYFPSGTYCISDTLTAYGNILISGTDSNNMASILKWIGSGTGPMIEFVKPDETITFRIVLEKLTLNGGTGTAPQGIRFHNVSEAELSRVFVQDCSDAFLLDSAAIMFMDRIDISGCEQAFNFETSSASPSFNNSFLTINRCNVFDISNTIFGFNSGAVAGLEIIQGWFENFACFIKNGNNGEQPSGFNHFNISKSKISNTSSSPYDGAKLIDITAPDDATLSQFLNFSMVETVCEVNSDDYICSFDLNGNSNANSSLGNQFNFENCLLFGAPDGVVTSNTAKTVCNFKGSTIAQTSFYSGTVIPFVSGSAKMVDSPLLTAYTVAWHATTADPTLGNGTLIGRYSVRNGFCRADIELTFGSTTTSGTGAYTFSLPIAHVSGWGKSVGAVYIPDIGTTNYTGVAIVDAGASVLSIAINNNTTFVGAANPITWAAGDKITVALEYPII